MCLAGVNSWKWSKKQTGTSVSWQSQTPVCDRSYLKTSQTEEHKHITFVHLCTLNSLPPLRAVSSPLQHTTIIYTNTEKVLLFFARYWRLSDCGTVFKEGVWQPRDFRFEVFGRWKVHPRSQSSAENQVQWLGFTVLERVYQTFTGQEHPVWWCK